MARSFSLKSLIVITLLVGMAFALVSANMESSRLKRRAPNIIDLDLPSEDWATVEEVSSNSYLVNVGSRAEIILRCTTRTELSKLRTELSSIHLKPGKNVIVIVCDNATGQFGICVDDKLQLHNIKPAVVGGRSVCRRVLLQYPQIVQIWSGSASGMDNYFEVELERKPTK